jgi:antitoxin FitA
MPNLSIKNVPEDVVEKLRQRAARHHRSLQGELMELICRSTDEPVNETGNSEIESSSPGWLSIDEVAAELPSPRRRRSGKVPLAVDIIRQERDAR